MTQYGLLEHFSETDDKENLKRYRVSANCSKNLLLVLKIFFAENAGQF